MIGITIRMSASENTVSTDDGAVFDRADMTGPEKRKLRRLVKGIYERYLENDKIA